MNFSSLSFNSITIISVLYAPILKAHELHELHSICHLSLDYNKCIEYNEKELNKIIKRQSDDINWKSYGPLVVYWPSWETLEGNSIALAKNTNKQIFYLAINCKNKLINATGENNSWKGWLNPTFVFEKNLVFDYCSMQ
tara:strand:- start:5063 stop:5479 length:417 start_codon:yes stop_codon:yes gene_type:complete